jgi:dTDP-4-amino-4,6-dideoxygalactose transaminase
MKSIPVTKSMLPPIEEYIEEIRELWDSHNLTNMGVKHGELEIGLSKYLKNPHLALFSNGDSALEAVLQSLGLETGGEIITTPFTFVSTTHAIVRSGFRPVFCDIDPKDCTMDTAKLVDLITPRTVAILPVHVYGHVCDVEVIGEIAKANGLKVIYDAAHSFGVEYLDRGIGDYGDASMFSFHATKVFHTVEGGAVACQDDRLCRRLNLMKNFGIVDCEHTAIVGNNAKMNEFQAAMGICNLRHIDEEIGKRCLLVERYCRNMESISGISLFDRRDSKHNYSYMPVRLLGGIAKRDALYDGLRDRGILVRKYFYPITSDFLCYEGLESATSGNTPVAKWLAEEILTLPLHGAMTLEDVDLVCYHIEKLL